jgi:hypothetical protein
MNKQQKLRMLLMEALNLLEENHTDLVCIEILHETYIVDFLAKTPLTEIQQLLEDIPTARKRAWVASIVRSAFPNVRTLKVKTKTYWTLRRKKGVIYGQET